MFSFFSKKKFVVDLLEGFIDIHNHILPGIDDGAKNSDESISLLKGFADFGVQDFICTPHIMDNYYPNTNESINKSLVILQNDLKINDLKNFNIQVAAEHMIDSEFENLLEYNKVMPLNKNYLLVEMSYIQASINFEQAILQVIDKGYFPVLAHPERYLYLHNRKKIYKKYKKMGVMFQLNLLSLSNYYGVDVKKIALELLEENLFDFVGSDVHNLRQLDAVKNLTLTPKVHEQLHHLIQMTNKYFSPTGY